MSLAFLSFSVHILKTFFLSDFRSDSNEKSHISSGAADGIILTNCICLSSKRTTIFTRKKAISPFCPFFFFFFGQWPRGKASSGFFDFSKFQIEIERSK